MLGQLTTNTVAFDGVPDRPGWWVLRRHRDGHWLPVQHCSSRARADQVWAQGFGAGDQRAMVHLARNGQLQVCRTVQVA